MPKFLVLAIFMCLTSFKPVAKTWTALGDSITYLNNHLDETGNRITKGYMTRVSESMPNIKFINQGHNGWTAVGIANEIENLGLVKTDIYTIFLGTNDWWSGLPVGDLNDYINGTGSKTVYGAFNIIIHKILKLNPDAKIILMTPLQRGDFVYVSNNHNNAWGSYKAKNGQMLSQFADAVKKIGNQDHYEVIDLYYKSGITPQNSVKFKRLKNPQTGFYKNYKYPDYLSVPFNADTDEYPYPPASIDNTFDGLHPSDKGLKIIADLLVKSFKKLDTK